MGTNEKILLGALGLGVVVAGGLYAYRSGLIGKKPIDTKKTDVPKVQTTYIPSAYTTPSSTRTRAIQTKLAQANYLPTSEIDGSWGRATNEAYMKANMDKGLKLISDEKSYRNWLTNFDGSTGPGNSSSFTNNSGTNLRSIADYINSEFRSMTTNYGAIRDKLKPLKASEIQSLDKIYREYSSKGLFADFKDDENGGKVASTTYNVTAIREILSDGGLKGIDGINTALMGIMV